MVIFGNDKKIRGCFTNFVFNIGGGFGAYLKLPTEQLPEGVDIQGSSEPMVVTGFSFSQREKVHIVQCFQDANYTYAFGHDPASSMLQVNYTGFLVSADGTMPSDAIDRFTRAYADNRVSNQQQYSKLTIGSSVLSGFLVGVSSATQDSIHNLQTFNLDLLVVEPF